MSTLSPSALSLSRYQTSRWDTCTNIRSLVTQIQRCHDNPLTRTGVQVHLHVPPGGVGTLRAGFPLLWGHLPYSPELTWVLLTCVHQSAHSGTVDAHVQHVNLSEFTVLGCLIVHVVVWFQMSLRLRFFDPQLKERPEEELFIEPDWLLHLRQLDGQIKVCVCL